MLLDLVKIDIVPGIHVSFSRGQGRIGDSAQLGLFDRAPQAAFHRHLAGFSEFLAGRRVCLAKWDPAPLDQDGLLPAVNFQWE